MRLYNIFNGNTESKEITVECFSLQFCRSLWDLSDLHQHRFFKHCVFRYGEPQVLEDAKFWRLPLKHGFFLEIMFSRYGFYFDILTEKREITLYSQYANGRHIGTMRGEHEFASPKKDYEKIAIKHGFTNANYRYVKRIYRKQIQAIANDYKFTSL